MTSSSNKFGGLRLRLMTAVVGAFIIIAGTAYSMWTYSAIFLGLSILTQWEFYKLAHMDDKLPLKVWGTVIGQSFFILTFLIEADIIELKYMLILFPLLASVFMIKLYKKNDEKPFTSIAYTFLGIIYVAIPFSLLNIIAFANDGYSHDIIVGIMLILWASDTGAYFSGIMLGKKKLFERVSPKKTWEGSIGGLLLALGMAYVLSRYFIDLTTFQWLAAAVIIVITGIYGDLIESVFKRGLEIKDSGDSLPGHGGFLDRFDSLLLAAPFIVVFIKLFS
ncbi:MAG: phosphatidate cytidylyltransferase [Bacteroidetes bacterium]|nr:MAG: phosphatidate cytidylyltransferase [Bacteroidota bacterium]